MGLIFGGKFALVIRGAYIRGGLYSGGAYIRDFTVFEFLSDTVSFELGLLETIGYFVICLSKEVLIFTEIVLITIN